MKTVLLTLALGALAVASTASMPNDHGRNSAAFHASINGAVSTSISGDARFGSVPASTGAPATFTVSLGAYGDHGSILFTSWSAGRRRASTGFPI